MTTQENEARFTTPVGRWVSGSLSQYKDKDDRGNPYQYKTGKNAGKNYGNFSIGVAFPKGPEAAQPYGPLNWTQTAWGAQLAGVGTRFRADAMNLGAGFSWKVEDGDSQVPNTKGVKPCDRDGWAGHWVVFFSMNVALGADGKPERLPCPLYTLMDDKAPGQRLRAPAPITIDRIKRGDYVQVSCDVRPNGEVQKPGVFVSANALCLLGYGEAIVGGFDVATAGFGQDAALPPGASMTPTAGFVPPVQGALPPTSAPTAPVLPPTGGTANLPPPLPLAANPVAPPNPAFLMPPPTAVAPPPTGPVMSAAAQAQGITWAILQQNGWTLEQAKQAGHVVA